MDVGERLPPEQLGTRTDIKGTGHCAGKKNQKERPCLGQSAGEGLLVAEAVLQARHWAM